MSRGKLLFVDDEPSIRLTLPAILEQEGFAVTTAATVAEALQCIVREQFDVLISDLNIGLPGDGFTVVSAMRRTQPHAVTMILTGYPGFETALRALREQVDDYVIKPADIKQMVGIIKDKLDAPKRKLPEQGKRVSTVLRENAGQIIEEWFQATLKDIELSRYPLSKEERVDHLPRLLEELAATADAGRFQSADSARDAARRHGSTRARQGFRPRHVAAEARLLQQAIANTLQKHFLAIDLSTLIPDMMRIGASLHDQTEQSLVAMEEEPLQKLA